MTDTADASSPRQSQGRAGHSSAMEESDVHEAKPTDREDLKHVDTVSTNDPAETPDGAAAEDGPIGVRVGYDPSNLGDDIPDAGDLTTPSPINEPLGKAPGM